MTFWISTVLGVFVASTASAQTARLDAGIFDPAYKPLPAAAIHLIPKFGSPDRYEARANEAGEIQLRAINPGNYVLSIRAPRFLEILREIRVAPGADISLGKLKLEPSGCGDPEQNCALPDTPAATMAVCGLLQNVSSYSRRHVVIVGWLTTEGSEVRLGGDCDFKLITAGSVWPNAIAVSGLPQSFPLSLSKQVAIAGVLSVLSNPVVVDCTGGHLCSYSYRFYPQAIARLEQASFQSSPK